MTSLRARKLLVSLFALLALVVAPVAASAHAGLVSANPEANSSASFMPKTIRITFSENLMEIKGKDINSISLSFMKYSDMGVGIALSDIKVDGPTITATIPAGQYETGNYVVTYSIVAQDGHKSIDSYQFSLHSFGSTLKSASPKPEVVKESHGVIPLPIVGAIALVIALGGLFIYLSRKS
jgi:methionine-rich copper-binding protein CopC